jgi:hypothetical protein
VFDREDVGDGLFDRVVDGLLEGVGDGVFERVGEGDFERLGEGLQLYGDRNNPVLRQPDTSHVSPYSPSIRFDDPSGSTTINCIHEFTFSLT